MSKFKLFRNKHERSNNKLGALSFKEYTFGYIAVCALILIGAPAQYTGTRIPINESTLPTVIGCMVGGYFAILLLVIGVSKIGKLFRGE